MSQAKLPGLPGEPSKNHWDDARTPWLKEILKKNVVVRNLQRFLKARRCGNAANTKEVPRSFSLPASCLTRRNFRPDSFPRPIWQRCLSPPTPLHLSLPLKKKKKPQGDRDPPRRDQGAGPAGQVRGGPVVVLVGGGRRGGGGGGAAAEGGRRSQRDQSARIRVSGGGGEKTPTGLFKT